MSTVEEIEKAVESLSPGELMRFRAWFDSFDSARFDETIEQDARSGNLDELARQAAAEHRCGGSRELRNTLIFRHSGARGTREPGIHFSER